jgi:hypothetical protein
LGGLWTCDSIEAPPCGAQQFLEQIILVFCHVESLLLLVFILIIVVIIVVWIK